MSRYLLALPLLLVGLPPALAADLAQVERTIKNQPKYVGKPAYCLLVLGPKAEERVWLIRDGDTLYADKNGNGDLTEPGEKIAADKRDAVVTFHAGTIRVGQREHRNLRVQASRLALSVEAATADPVSKAALAKDKDVDLMCVGAEVEMPGIKGDGDDGRVAVSARFDSDGPLLFGDSAKTAPVLHFGGPLQLRTEVAKPALYRNVVHDLMLTVGTPGVGPGTFANIGCETTIPKDAYVLVEAEFPPLKPGEPPVQQKFELKERC